MKVEYVDHMGSDMSAVKAARVSFANADDDGRTPEQNEKLINYLANHNHWTPFAHTAITLRMTAPVPIRTQCMKHAIGFAINEESRRYISDTPEYFIPTFRASVKNKKQGSGGELDGRHKVQSLLTGSQETITESYTDFMELSIEQYELLLGAGVCEEQARFVLPQGCLVNWYWTGSLYAFARFFNLRADTHSQLEIQELARMVGEVIEPLFPMSWGKLTNK